MFKHYDLSDQYNSYIVQCMLLRRAEMQARDPRCIHMLVRLPKLLTC